MISLVLSIALNQLESTENWPSIAPGSMMTIPVAGKPFKVKSFQSIDGAAYGKYILNSPLNSGADSKVLAEACYGVNFKQVSVSDTNYILFVTSDSDISRLIVCEIQSCKLKRLKRFEVKGNISYDPNSRQILLTGFGYDPLTDIRFDETKYASYRYAVTLKRNGSQLSHRVDIPRIN